MHTVLVLGGYGNFGKRISQALAKAGVSVIVVGRDAQKAEALARKFPGARATAFDVSKELAVQLELLKPIAVVNTCGPFQTADYSIAKTCIRQGVHYIDLADGRDFVVGISDLDSEARRQNVSVISGASTVPGLSSAVLEQYKHEFGEITSLRFGISPGQKAERGLATTKGIMTYVGKPLKPFPGKIKTRYGWQDIYRQEYPELGKRWMANCDIPDLDLLPPRYGIKSIQFSAGMELSFIHLGIWFLSWLVRCQVPINLPRHANLLLNISNLFNVFGSPHGGMHMIIKGVDTEGNKRERRWFIIAQNGDGPNIPCVPAIVLAKKLASGINLPAGAYPCVGMLSLAEYMAELEEFHIFRIELGGSIDETHSSR